MIDANDATLAQLSLASYSDTPALPAGFAAAPLTLGADAGTATLDASGVYHNGNAAALVTTGIVDGVQSLVIAFRGSDDREDSLNDLRDINADFGDFAPLITASDAFAASGAVQQVVVTGHSLGGAMAQLYMTTHPDDSVVAHRGETFGSPGALQMQADDPRVENVVIADDPAVALGAHRAEIGDALRADPNLANAAAERAAEEFPGLTPQDGLDSLGVLTANYVNHGTIALLPSVDGELGITGSADLLRGDEARHDPALYASLTAEAAAGLQPQQDLPETPTSFEEAWLRGVYAGEYPPGVDVSGFVHELASGWANTRDGVPDILAQTADVAQDAADTIASAAHDVLGFAHDQQLI